MSLIGAGKCCVYCSKTQNPEAKTTIQDYMFDHLSAALATSADDVEKGISEEEDFITLRYFVRHLEIKCFRCDGASAAVYREVDEGHVKLLEAGIEEAIKEAEQKEAEEKEKDKKSKNSGGTKNNLLNLSGRRK